MFTIYKYHIPVTDKLEIELPKAYKILSFDTQDNDLYLWCLVDTNAEKNIVKFSVFGTGFEIKPEEINNLEYVGTAQQNKGGLIWHLFKNKQ